MNIHVNVSFMIGILTGLITGLRQWKYTQFSNGLLFQSIFTIISTCRSCKPVCFSFSDLCRFTIHTLVKKNTTHFMWYEPRSMRAISRQVNENIKLSLFILKFTFFKFYNWIIERINNCIKIMEANSLSK